MNSIYDILTSLGYRLQENGNYYRTSALFRDGDNQTALSINKQTGWATDFKTGDSYSFKELIKLTAGEKANDILRGWSENSLIEYAPVMRVQKHYKFNPSDLQKLKPKWDLYSQDGVSEQTMRDFQVGFKESGALAGRYCFPVYNDKSEIIGFSGRWKEKIPFSPKIPKWKHLGHKTDWVWPAHLNKDLILGKREVMLIESPNCGYHLWDHEKRNFICLFGTQMGPKLFNFLIAARLDRIIIATNNDKKHDGAGQIAAKKIKATLSNFYREEKLDICLPHGNFKDFGEMPCAAIQDYLNHYNIK